MFSAIGQTAFTVLLLQLAVCIFKGFIAAPGVYAKFVADHPKQLRGLSFEMKKHHARYWSTVFILRGIFSRCWFLSDYIFAAHGHWHQVSRIRVMALGQLVLCTVLSGLTGFDLQDAFGLGSIAAVGMFAVGALAVYSGKLQATAGDKRIFGIQATVGKLR